jgi:hypothetical protein
MAEISILMPVYNAEAFMYELRHGLRQKGNFTI